MQVCLASQASLFCRISSSSESSEAPQAMPDVRTTSKSTHGLLHEVSPRAWPESMDPMAERRTSIVTQDVPSPHASSPRCCNSPLLQVHLEASGPRYTQRRTAECVVLLCVSAVELYVILAVMPFATSSDSTPSARLDAHHALFARHKNTSCEWCFREVRVH